MPWWDYAICVAIGIVLGIGPVNVWRFVWGLFHDREGNSGRLSHWSTNPRLGKPMTHDSAAHWDTKTDYYFPDKKRWGASTTYHIPSSDGEDHARVSDKDVG